MRAGAGYVGVIICAAAKGPKVRAKFTAPGFLPGGARGGRVRRRAAQGQRRLAPHRRRRAFEDAVTAARAVNKSSNFPLQIAVFLAPAA